VKGLIYSDFGFVPTVEVLPDPSPSPGGVVVEVSATGICRSDWHGWMGHDPDISLPHVPGHEMVGVVQAVGAEVKQWHVGDRVTVPFVGGCGHCEECDSGNQQVCRNQFQPGFTHWGSFAEYVAIDYADVNLVAVPESITDTTAASLGCRFATSFRAVVDQACVVQGEWVVVHGCGGVGLSAVMIAAALGARVVATDIAVGHLALEATIGAEVVIDVGGMNSAEVVEAVIEATGGGAHVSVDALGSRRTSFDSIAGLRRLGRHVQIGLMTGDHAHSEIPFDLVVSRELRIMGSHGMQAHRYPEMLAMIEDAKLAPEKLVGRAICLDLAADVLTAMGIGGEPGVVVIDSF